MVKRNSKAGPYPNADRNNLFGTLLLQFYQAEGRLRGQAFEGMIAITTDKCRKDAEFNRLYQAASKDGTIDEFEMHRLVIEMCRVMGDGGAWDYTGTEFDEDYEAGATEEDVVSLVR